MGIVYPGGVDAFNVPSLPENTPLSEAGSATRNHPELHTDINSAVEVLEATASFKDHDHSGDGSTAHGNKLVQANTHQAADTDSSNVAIHHTLGPTPYQAAPGNHVHHYSQILDRPYIVCTTTTRPTAPFIGMQIYETDTNTVRVWAIFPTNPDATGVIGTDNFRRTSDFDLGPSLWLQLYLLANAGLFCTPFGVAAWWLEELTEDNWCFARRAFADDEITLSDDQEITIIHGTNGFDIVSVYGDDDAPCNDYFFRSSEDQLHYVRLGIFYNWAVLYYTVNGQSNEVVLGTLLSLPFWEENLLWTVRCVDWEWHIYRNGVFAGSIVDNERRSYRDSFHRYWGIGCHVKGHAAGQHRPPDVANCQIKDVTSYVPTARWGLLPVASVPIIIAETHERQEVLPGLDHILRFTDVLEDFPNPALIGLYLALGILPFIDLEVSDTDITIREPGVYHVHASICWDPAFTFCDHSLISITVNGADISRKNWEFIRGYGFFPGFSQTNEINFWRRFNVGDVLRVVVRHNGGIPCWLWFTDLDPDRQVCHLELVYHTP